MSMKTLTAFFPGPFTKFRIPDEWNPDDIEVINWVTIKYKGIIQTDIQFIDYNASDDDDTDIRVVVTNGDEVFKNLCA